jgi:hypothetical protein
MHEATRIKTRHLIVGAIAVEFLGLIALVAHVS